MTGPVENSKPFTGYSKIRGIEGDESIRPAINVGLQAHLVIRVPYLRAPLKMCLNGLDQCRKFRKKLVNCLGS
jgi:hypothetical protein